MTEYLRKNWLKLSRGKRLAALVGGMFTGVEVLMGVALAQVDTDPDQDGFLTSWEEAVGTDPLDSLSHPTLADNQYKLLAYWPLMTNAVEASGSGLDGSLENGAAFGGSAVALDGKDDYVGFGNDPGLSMTSSMSYCVWLNPATDRKMMRTLGKFQTQGQERECAVFYGAEGRLWVFYSDNGTPQDSHSMLLRSMEKVFWRRTSGSTWL